MRRHHQPVSVVMVGAVSAAIQGGLAVLFVPTLSFFFAMSVPSGGILLENGMTLAVLAPLAVATCGFFLGAFMAFVYNMFVNQESARARVVTEERVRVSGSVESAA